jgi:transposase InsO family protein
MREYFYWRRMRREIVQIIRSCDLCQKAKILTHTLAGEMSSLLPDRPNQLAATDLFGPLPRSRGGVMFVLVILDVFSKHVKLYALKKATTKAIVNRLTGDYLVKVGKCEKLLSDNGSQYSSRHWNDALEKENIQPVHSTVRHPQSNPSERVMRELGRMIRTYCHEHHTQWSDYLSTIESWINVTVHASTGMSPTMLHFGKQPQQAIHDLLNTPPSAQVSPSHDDLIVLARDKMKRESMTRQRRHDSNHKCETLKVNDLVLLKTHSLSSAIDKTIHKFLLLYKGPYKVGKLVAPNAYQLLDMSGNNVGTWNIVHLRKYYTQEQDK